jgi:hypothetical protein
MGVKLFPLRQALTRYCLTSKKKPLLSGFLITTNTEIILYLALQLNPQVAF